MVSLFLLSHFMAALSPSFSPLPHCLYPTFLSPYPFFPDLHPPDSITLTFAPCSFIFHGSSTPTSFIPDSLLALSDPFSLSTGRGRWGGVYPKPTHLMPNEVSLTRGNGELYYEVYLSSCGLYRQWHQLIMVSLSCVTVRESPEPRASRDEGS